MVFSTKSPQPHNYSLYHPLKPMLCIPHYQIKASSQGKIDKSDLPSSTAMVQDIIALKQAFPDSFDTIANMSGTYTIRANPSVTPVQHTLYEGSYWLLGTDWVHLQWHGQQGVLAPVSHLNKWISSLTCPHKPDGTLHICLDPKDLKNAIVWEHYKVPNLDEIVDWLHSTTCFCKLVTKDSFWSIHLDEKYLYLTTFNMHHGRHRFLHMPFCLKMSQDIFQM